MWGAVLGAGVGAGVGAIQAGKKRDQEIAYNKAQSDITRYSPWTGVRGEIKPVTSDAFSGALQGGFGGMMMGQQLGGMAGGGAAAPAAGNSAINTTKPVSIYDQMGSQQNPYGARNPFASQSFA